MYCPFGDNSCGPEQYGLSEIVAKIVEDSVAATANNNNELHEDGTDEGKEKDSVRTHHFNTPYSETDLNEMKSILVKIIQFGSLINNKSLISALETLKLVYGARYDILKRRTIGKEVLFQWDYYDY